MKQEHTTRLTKLHAWTGVALVIPLFFIALTGACLLHKDAIFVPADWRTAPPARSLTAIDAEIARLMLLPDLRMAELVKPARGMRAFHLVTNADGSLSYWRIGAVAAATSVPWRIRLENYVIEFHEHLLLGETGDIAVRIISPLAAVLIIVGFVLWWPLRRGWRSRDLLPRSAARPQLVRSHRAIAAAGSLLLITHAVTGALMANSPSIRAWLKPLTKPEATAIPAAATLGFQTGDAADAIAALRRVFDRGDISQLSPIPGAAGLQWSLRLRLPGEDHPNGRSNVTLDLANGQLIAIRDARKAGIPGSYDDTVFPLHTGTLLGPAQRWVWTLGALTLAVAVLLGALSFFRKQLSVRRP